MLTHTSRRRDVTSRWPVESVFFVGVDLLSRRAPSDLDAEAFVGLSQATSDAGRCMIRHSNGCSLSMQRCICRNRSGTRLPSRVRGPDRAFRQRQDSLRSGRGSDGLRMTDEGISHPLVAAGARQWAHQRAVVPHPSAELANAGLTIIVDPPAWHFRWLVARLISRPKSSLRTEGSLVLEANRGLDQGSTDCRFVQRAHLAGA